MDVPDQPNSICHVQPIQMYPLPTPNATCDDAAESLVVPFKLLAGEAVFHHGNTVDGAIVLTNYRVYIQDGDTERHHVPLGLVEVVEHRDLFYLHIGCKDARTYRCTFGNNESCMEWYDRLSKAAEPPKQLEQTFAFYHFIWAKDRGGDDVQDKIRKLRNYNFDHQRFRDEMERLGFKGDSWRITEANKAYKLCPTYPPYLIVPSCINDEALECVAKFRSSRRVPAVVWRHQGNGAVIARCSQPEVGWLGWRRAEDEDLIKAISDACNFDQTPDKDSILSHSPNSFNSDDSGQCTNTPTTAETPTEEAGCSGNKQKKVLIMDARSYTTAVANRARGGGCECADYYPNCEIQFMNLANIHSIRKSFHSVRVLCMSSADQPTWYSQLEGTRWLQHISGLMKSAVTLVKAVERDARPVLVHCSDGWDRTPQIVALAELLLDPYYRTIDGFRILIEREWLAFGHKFADRCGNSCGSDDQNERCPVFLQWLDCVHQLLTQFTCAFEFSQTYLVKLTQHIYSNLYGTFLCNTFQERMRIVNGKTFSVWQFLSDPIYKNHLYAPPGDSCGNKVLWPQYSLRDIRFWSEVYLGTWESNTGGSSCPGPPETASPSHMTKTRSYGDLLNATGAPQSGGRRNSDPSLNNIESKPNNITITPPTAISNGACKTTAPSSTIDDELLVDCRNHQDSNRTQQSVIDICNSCNVDNKTLLDDKYQEDRVVDDLCEQCQSTGIPIPPPLPLATSKQQPNCDNGGCHDDNDDDDNSDPTKSIETSTDTLVSEMMPNVSASPSEINGFERLQAPPSQNGSSSSSAKQMSNGHETAVDESKRRKSRSPLHSSSSSGWDNGLPPPTTWHHSNSAAMATATATCNLGDDGLTPVRSVAQERLWQIIQEHRRKEELLEKELQTYRTALLKTACCQRCNTEYDRTDDNSSDDDSASDGGSDNTTSNCEEPGSVVESVGSGGEGHASAVESLRSEMSWEAVEENAILNECSATDSAVPILWVPDHAVSRCTGCQTEFWVGKRKHHCRKCGRIFCASCSENSTPLPSEQLYNPVRVCTGCYTKLRRDCGEIPDQCKHANGQSMVAPPTNGQQITASSN